MKSITEEMRFRQRLCEYALKYGVTKAARRYHTSIMIPIVFCASLFPWLKATKADDKANTQILMGRGMV